MDAPPLLFSLSEELGQEYLAAMQLAGEYASAGRRAVVAQVLAIIGARAVDEVHNHHNFAWLETHDGVGEVCVVRKGSTPNFPGQRSFVGGSMGSSSYVLRGLDHPVNAASLYSTIPWRRTHDEPHAGGWQGTAADGLEVP